MGDDELRRVESSQLEEFVLFPLTFCQHYLQNSFSLFYIVFQYLSAWWEI